MDGVAEKRHDELMPLSSHAKKRTGVVDDHHLKWRTITGPFHNEQYARDGQIIRLISKPG